MRGQTRPFTSAIGDRPTKPRLRLPRDHFEHSHADDCISHSSISAWPALMAEDWKITYPPRFSEADLAAPHISGFASGSMRAIWTAVIKDGTNVICGGTNAAGIGFAGGPFILGKNGEIVDIRSGVPVPEKTLAELRARVDTAHAKGAKVLGEVIRFYMTPWIQAEHPDWQDINSPGGKPITVAQLKDMHVLGCWNSPYGDWFIKSQVELVKRLDWDGYNMDGFGCWSQCFCPSCAAAYRSDTGKEIPATGDVNSSGVSPLPQVAARSVHPFRLQVDGGAQGGQTRLRGGALDDGPGPLVALDGRARGRGNRRDAPRARRAVPRAVLGLSARTKGATCCRRLPAGTTAA